MSKDEAAIEAEAEAEIEAYNQKVVAARHEWIANEPPV